MQNDNSKWSWRPRSLNEFIGQADLVRRLRVEVGASQRSRRPLPHAILHGPSGLGKTTIPQVLAAVIGAPPVIELMGTGLTVDVLADVLGANAGIAPEACLNGDGWQNGPDGWPVLVRPDLFRPSIVLCDEIDSAPTPVLEMLYRVLEPTNTSRHVVPIKVRGSTKSHNVFVMPATWICATNKLGGVINRAPGLLQRCPIVYQFKPYTTNETLAIVMQFAGAVKVGITENAANMIAVRSGGFPRDARNHFELAYKVLLGRGLSSGIIDVDVVEESLDIGMIDSLGLDDAQRQYLQALADSSTGRLSLPNLISILNGDSSTITRIIEPKLIRLRLIEVISGTGREITHLGRAHVNRDRPAQSERLNRIIATV